MLLFSIDKETKADVQWSPEPPASVPLPESSVHVWRTRICDDDLGDASLFEGRFAARKHFLITVLARYLGCKPDALLFEKTQMGKPRLALVEGRTPLRFNFSHSGEWAVVAVSATSEIGVDLEKIDRSSLPDPIVMRLFSEDEKVRYFTAESENRLSYFYDLWVQKESLLKASGVGFKRPLNEMKCVANHDASWHLTRLPFDENHKLAVATDRSGHAFHLFEV